ncbi:unannotated protein [freshwater metagenome]|uniref:Unannotated protein n=1 Tax=freshwater metagenome TaxID=449393 RepID=A0A6J7AW25_9ZZZZ
MHTKPRPEVREPRREFGRVQLLDDGAHLYARDERQPEAGPLPASEMRQREDRSGAALERGVNVLVADDVESSRHCLDPEARQLEALHVVAGVGRICDAHESAELAALKLRTMHPAQISLDHGATGAAARPQGQAEQRRGGGHQWDRRHARQERGQLIDADDSWSVSAHFVWEISWSGRARATGGATWLLMRRLGRSDDAAARSYE